MNGKIALIDDFHNPTLRELAIRYIGRLQPESLTAAQLQSYQKYLASSTVDYRNKPRYSVSQALSDIQELKQNSNLTPKKQTLLDELYHYISNHPA